MAANTTTPRWGMVVDINRCVGCQTCTIACKHANDTTPGVQWRSVLDVELGTYPDVQREFLVTGCQHCAEPPCVPVCPTGATLQREDGLVTMDYDLCIGCGYCAVSCPYQARTIVHEQRGYFGNETRQEQATAHDERIGVAQKCTFCMDRVDEGLELGRQPGEDLDYTPACAASCVAEAISFGDFNNPDSRVSRLTAENSSFQMHAELGTDPQIKYLYELPATPGHDTDAVEMDAQALSDPASPLTGKRQQFWDIRAAMNFILGGMGSGLVVLATLAHFFADLSLSGLMRIYLAGGLLIATGLFFVFLEIGRKLRFLYVLLRPQSSWMTRETYTVAVFYPVLLADLVWPQAWLHSLLGMTALVFLVCQARILFAARGIPAWRAPLVPWLLLASGLLEGFGVYLLLQAFVVGGLPLGTAEVYTGMALVILTGCLWIAYRVTARSRGLPVLARQVIDRCSPFIVVPGYIIPLIGLALLQDADSINPGLYLFTAAGAILGGVLWKLVVITRACYEQGFAIPKIPQRGSGKRAAPARLLKKSDK